MSEKSGGRLEWLQSLIDDIDAICRCARDDAAAVTAVAHRLAACERDCRLPEPFRETSADRYTQHLIHAAENGSFSIVALAWRPGQFTPVHDHRAWCAVSVCEGAERETRYRVGRDDAGPYLTVVSETVLEPGKTVALLPDGSDVHRVSNCSSQTTVSIHVYGLDIRDTGTSIGSVFDAVPVRPAAASLA